MYSSTRSFSFLGWSSEHCRDSQNLIELLISRKERRECHLFIKEATEAPYFNRELVKTAENEFQRFVRQSKNHRRVRL
jgi:hypothetical protein